MRERVAVRTPIKLQAFLQRAGIAATGGQVKILLVKGAVSVNGESERRRGRRLRAGDIVEVAGAGAFEVSALNQHDQEA